MKKHQGRSTRESIRLSAPSERVWDAFADPSKIAGWFVDAAEGNVAPGELWTWVWKKYGVRAEYRVIDASRPDRLLVEFEGRRGGPPGLIEITIRRDRGDTLLELVNSGFGSGPEWDDEYEGVRSGWHIAVRILKFYLDRHWSESRSDLLVQHNAAFDRAMILPYQRTENGLAQWLTRSGSIPPVGRRAQLTLWNGMKLSGEVLALSDFETAVAWDEMNGVIEMKGFGSNRLGPALEIHGSFWSPPRAVDALERELAPRLEILAARLAAEAGHSSPSLNALW
jgi:uncharacterized protein YndB with AHSA1/START domain